MSADGKIADRQGLAARFGSKVDRQHLEQQIAAADAVLLGAGTLRAYGTSLPVTNPQLLAQRLRQGRTPQPIQIIGSGSGQIDRTWKFFQQSFPRWLITTSQGARLWQEGQEFTRILHWDPLSIDWLDSLNQLYAEGIHTLAVLGGGTLVATLLEKGLIDEFRITVCPLVLGGLHTITPVEGSGFLADYAPRLQLLSAQVIEHEVFLHYKVLTS
jgi:5-amino-6-(5-phosphoribosylamino)uracil reductase